MDDLTSDRWGIWMTILQNLTWNGHETSVIQEWVAQDGAGDRHFNAHNAFLGVTYNNGFIAGILLCAYTVLAFIRALRIYADENAGGTGSLEKLESALEQATGSAWDGYLSDMLAF